MGRSPWSESGRMRRIGASAVVSAMAASAFVGLPATANAATPTEQSLDTAPSTVPEGNEITFTGTLTGAGERPVEDETVELQSATGHQSQWSAVDNAVTDENGEVAIPARISDSGDWRMVYEGNTLREGSESTSEHVETEDATNEEIAEHAAAQEGQPYEYGANGPDSFDCSGLIEYAHGQAGIDLPRTTSEQRDATPSVDKSDRQQGDIIFFHDGNGVYHNGIYAGDDQIWHSPQPGESVELTDLGTEDYSVGRAW